MYGIFTYMYNKNQPSVGVYHIWQLPYSFPDAESPPAAAMGHLPGSKVIEVDMWMLRLITDSALRKELNRTGYSHLLNIKVVIQF